jgi:hypothetical protein
MDERKRVTDVPFRSYFSFGQRRRFYSLLAVQAFETWPR